MIEYLDLTIYLTLCIICFKFQERKPLKMKKKTLIYRIHVKEMKAHISR